MDKNVLNNLHKVRTKAREHYQRNTVSNIFMKSGVSPSDAVNSSIGNEKIRDLWNLVKGHDTIDDNYFSLNDLSKAIKDSHVLKNAYNACLQSKVYSDNKGMELKGQKLKSYVYLKQNNLKLPQKRKNELMRDNFFLD